MSAAESVPEGGGNGAPVMRVLLWGLLAGVLGAVIVAAIWSRSWSRTGVESELPVLAHVPPFELVNRDGRTVSLDDLSGTPWIANFIFTRCGGACPRMTERMRHLGSTLGRLGVVRRVSFSVDPTYDTPEVMAAYAATYSISDPGWYFLTGDREPIYELIRDGFLLAVDSEPPPEIVRAEEPIVHSSRFVLVDAAGAIRGYYESTEPGKLDELLRDVETLVR